MQSDLLQQQHIVTQNLDPRKMQSHKKEEAQEGLKCYTEGGRVDKKKKRIIQKCTPWNKKRKRKEMKHVYFSTNAGTE